MGMVSGESVAASRVFSELGTWKDCGQVSIVGKNQIEYDGIENSELLQI